MLKKLFGLDKAKTPTPDTAKLAAEITHSRLLKKYAVTPEDLAVIAEIEAARVAELAARRAR